MDVEKILEGALLVHRWGKTAASDPTFETKWDAWTAWRVANPELVGHAWAIERYAYAFKKL